VAPLKVTFERADRQQQLTHDPSMRCAAYGERGSRCSCTVSRGSSRSVARRRRWLTGLNGCRSELRRRPTAELDGSHGPSATSAESAVLTAEERREIIHAPRCLPYRQREVRVLRFYLDLPDDQIAVTMRISQSTVRSAFMAYRQPDDCLRQRHDGELRRTRAAGHARFSRQLQRRKQIRTAARAAGYGRDLVSPWCSAAHCGWPARARRDDQPGAESVDRSLPRLRTGPRGPPHRHGEPASPSQRDLLRPGVRSVRQRRHRFRAKSAPLASGILAWTAHGTTPIEMPADTVAVAW
jgi:hypothetical protein